VTDHQKLSIDTPEQINLEFELAGPGSRFMALFVDLMIQGLATIVIVIGLAIAGFAIHLRAAGTWVMAWILLAMFAVHWGYFAFFEIVWKGQTPGKRQAGIRVINETGRMASVYEAIARNLLRVVDAIGLYAVGALVMFLSPQSKRIGDYVAGTVVVHDRRREDGALFFNTQGAALEDSIRYEALTVQDLQVLETFLQRRLDLPPEVRRQTADKLARHFRQKCSVPEGILRDNENLLETLVRGFRRGGRF
jgi:uncharacterized RDD family membrane protein YckC